jgi:cytoskeletal protein RodZ|tara:strand:- start:312 stop:779 length:468 start_codon:yes stop_codon:yes gene_type:complete
MPTFIRPTRTLVATLAATAVLAACSNTDDTTPGSAEPTSAPSSATPSTASTPEPTASDSVTASEEPAPARPLLSVTIAGEDVQPNAQEIDLATGEKLAIEIQSDRAGELHVHSTPEQFIEFDAGTTSTRLVIETPGSVEVEDHDTSDVVALIEVR